MFPGNRRRDLRTLSPSDADTVVAAAGKSGRAPVLRATGRNTPVPCYKLEERCLPAPDRIRRAVEQIAAL